MPEEEKDGGGLRRRSYQEKGDRIANKTVNHPRENEGRTAITGKSPHSVYHFEIKP